MEYPQEQKEDKQKQAWVGQVLRQSTAQGKKGHRLLTPMLQSKWSNTLSNAEWLHNPTNWAKNPRSVLYLVLVEHWWILLLAS